jgi:uncharacterized protein YyaL (SSP411 family)
MPASAVSHAISLLISTGIDIDLHGLSSGRTGMPQQRAWALLSWLLLLPALAWGNGLAGHPSPYLALHANDPVQWRAWGPAALAEARATNRPLLISSGYFACHWCHVMQRESWQDPQIAELLSSQFIPVKLDRELHPALDAYLIDFAEQSRGQAGWPLNVFLTPAGHPFYAALYLPADQMRALSERIAALWQDRSETLADLARQAARERVARAASEAADGDSGTTDSGALRAALLQRALELGDPLSGGFGQQTRFPMAPQLAALLELLADATDAGRAEAELAELLRLTLDQMAGQGLADLLAGGFFRYTVDPGWQVPHFEKMLYTQALLVPVYLRAAEVFDRPEYRGIARTMLDFMLSTMTAPNGLMIASLSAVDADGIEGGYYLWDAAELARLLTPGQRAAVALVWGLAGVPEQDGGLLPRRRAAPAAVAERHRLDVAALENDLDEARAALMAERRRRSLPRDHKTLAGWNGLALTALVAGARAFPESRYRPAAARLRDALLSTFLSRDGLLRSPTPADRTAAPIEATVADYAYVAAGLADWAELAEVPADRALARDLAREAFQRFRRDGLWQREATPLLPDIPGVLAWSDAPLPAPDAVLLRLLMQDPEPHRRRAAQAVLEAALPSLKSDPFDKALALMLLLRTRDENVPPLSATSSVAPVPRVVD